MMVSVAMAVYNGERYLREQMDSILVQLQAGDEVVVSLDPSMDGGEAILREYCLRDDRVRMVSGPGRGLMKNFENAIMQCKGDVIFLADQDDCWEPDKVKACLACFEEPEVWVVLHDARVLDGNLQDVIYPSFFSYKGSKKGFWRNVLKNSYMGCCMAMRREVLYYALPFPENIPMHDQWIGLLAERYGKSVFLAKPLLLYRRHEGNMTGLSHAGLFQMLLWRIQIIMAVYRAKKRK